MTTLPIALLGVLLVSAVMVTGAQGPPPTDLVAVDTFIDAPRALFGRTRAGVEKTLGAPASTSPRTLDGGTAHQPIPSTSSPTPAS